MSTIRSLRITHLKSNHMNGSSIEVTASGAIGKQTFASTRPAVLQNVILAPASVSAATLVIRDGNASGEVKLTVNLPANTPQQFRMGKTRFDKGMHVKVTPANAKAYLIVA